MFGFEPTLAAGNLLEIARIVIIVVAAFAVIRFIFTGQIFVALGIIAVAAFLSFSFQPDVMSYIGEMEAEILTINKGQVVDSESSETPQVTDQTKAQTTD